MKLINPISIVALAYLLLACNDIKSTVEKLQDKSASYAAINTSLTGGGSTRPHVLELMGTPTKIDAYAIAGVDNEVLEFTDSRGSYRVRLINSRAVSKSATAYQPISTTR